MDVQGIVGQLVKSAADDPSMLEHLGVNPGEAIKNATGLDLDEHEVAEVVEAVSPLLRGKDLDLGKVMEAAGDILGDGDILGKLGGLFGGGKKDE